MHACAIRCINQVQVFVLFNNIFVFTSLCCVIRCMVDKMVDTKGTCL